MAKIIGTYESKIFFQVWGVVYAITYFVGFPFWPILKSHPLTSLQLYLSETKTLSRTTHMHNCLYERNFLLYLFFLFKRKKYFVKRRNMMTLHYKVQIRRGEQGLSRLVWMGALGPTYAPLQRSLKEIIQKWMEYLNL